VSAAAWAVRLAPVLWRVLKPVLRAAGRPLRDRFARELEEMDGTNGTKGTEGTDEKDDSGGGPGAGVGGVRYA